MQVNVVGAAWVKAYTSTHGYPVAVDVQAKQVTVVEFDGVVGAGRVRP